MIRKRRTQGSFSASLYALAKVQLAPVLVLLRFPHMKRAVHHCVLFLEVVEVDCLYFCLFFVCHRLIIFLIRLQNYINFRHHQDSQSKMHSCRAVMGGLRRSEGTSEGLKNDVSHHHLHVGAWGLYLSSFFLARINAEKHGKTSS